MNLDYTERGQWLRAAILGANDGLLSTASLMMGVGAVQKDVKTMKRNGSLYDIEMAQMKRKVTTENMGAEELDVEKEKLPNPWHAAGASALSFVVRALVSLLGVI
ncbi:vacuolar iron transporter like 4 [Fagus crenata]